MSPVAAWLAAAFMAWPGPAEIEPQASRAARIETVAEAIAAESSTLEEAALEAATVWEESGRLSYAVHSGARRGDHGRSVCLGQVQAQGELLPRAEWATLTGIDAAATRRCVAASVRILRHVAGFCDRETDRPLERLARRVAAYGTGRGCRTTLWAGAVPRARRALRLLESAPLQGEACSGVAPCRMATIEAPMMWPLTPRPTDGMLSV